MDGRVPIFFSGHGEDVTQPDNDQAEGNPDRWTGLWRFNQVSTREREDGRSAPVSWPCEIVGGTENGEHTAAENVYERLLLARKAMKFIVAKVLKRCSVNFISGPSTEHMPYVHRAALSMSTFIARCQQRVDQLL